MATVTIRNLSEETRRALKARAGARGRSMEAEARDILQHAVGTHRDFIGAWLDAASSLRGEFEVPQRSLAREVDLS